MSAPSLAALHNIATQLRIDSVRSTTEAGSGHPTTCLSAAEIVAALFFAEMRFDPKDPHHPQADRFVLSKGHVLSQEDVSGENDKAAHGKCRVDADHYPRDPDLEDTCEPHLPRAVARRDLI